MRKKVLLAIFVLVAIPLVTVIAQTQPRLLGLFWDTVARRYNYYALGTGFKVESGTISVDFSSVPLPQIPKAVVYGRLVTQAADGSYSLPVDCDSAKPVQVYVNGLRYNTDSDYSITNGKLVPKYPWSSADWEVRVDYIVK